MLKKYEYETELIKGPHNHIYAGFPFDCSAEFGSRKTIRVKVSFGMDYQKFWIQEIEGTKNEETKIERINKLFNFLRSGSKTGY